MENAKTKIKKIMATLCTASILLSSLQIVQVKAINAPNTANKLNYSKYVLADNTGINSDITIGQMPNGVTIESPQVSITSPETAKFAFTSDDGAENDWNYKEIFTSRGVSCTIPLVEDYVSGRVSQVQISIDKLRTLQNEFGYEIGSHAYDHLRLSEMPIQDANFQMTESKKSLTAMGLNVKNMYLPYGAYNQEVLDEAKKIYRAVRTSDIGQNTPLDKRNLKVYWLDSYVQLSLMYEQALSIVDDAINHNQFIIFGFHSSSVTLNYMNNMIAKLMDYIQSSQNGQILTVDKALDRIENVITENQDYKVINGKIILDKFFLRSLPIGTNNLSFKFSDGTSESISLIIEKNNGARHDLIIKSTTLNDGSNILNSNQKIVIETEIDTNMAADRSSYAQIGEIKAYGLQNDQGYSYTFNSNDIPDGEYSQITLTSKIGSDIKTTAIQVMLKVEKTNPITPVTELIITKLPDKSVYTEGDSFTGEGLVITANYEDETSGTINSYEISGYTSTPGIKTITIIYYGKTVSFDINVSPKKITKLSILTNPITLTYLQGDPLDLTGMVVYAYFNNGTSQLVSNYSVTGDTSVPGVIDIKIGYLELIEQFTINVKAKTTTSLSISTLPRKLQFFNGEDFAYQGLVITANNLDGTSAVIRNSVLAFSGYDPNKLGEQTIKVAYDGCETTYTIMVSEIVATGIEITTMPLKTQYKEGEAFNSDGISVTVSYNDGSTKLITDYSLSGYTSDPGIKTIIVASLGLSTEFNITVKKRQLISIKITNMPDTKTYIEGVPFDPKGMIVTAYYDNQTSENINGYTIEEYIDSPGEKEVTVSFGGQTDILTITILSKELDSISILSNLRKTTYFAGENLNLTGLIVSANYNNGTSRTINDYEITGYNKDLVGDQILTLTYGGCTAKINVKVLAVKLLSIEIMSLPYILTYKEGENLKLDGLTLNANYNNGSVKVITNYTVSGYTNDPGKKTITLTYLNCVAEFIVTVVAKTVDSIKITALPTKKVYTVGEALDLRGMVLTVYFTDKSSSNPTDYIVSGYTSTQGTKTININYRGKSASFTVTVNPKWIKVAPASLKAESISYNSVKLTWGTVIGASGYNIYRSTSSSGPYQAISSSSLLSYTDNALTTGKIYYYKVDSYFINQTVKENGPLSTIVSAKPLPSVPAAFTGVSNSYNSNKISWSTVAGASGYSIYRSDTKTGTYALIATTSANSYINTGLVPGKFYYYKVLAYRLSGTTKITGNFTTIQEIRCVPSVPVNLTTVKYSAGSIKLAWSAVSGASGYEIYSAATTTSTYTLIATTTSTSFINSKLIANKVYYYKVRAYRIIAGKKVYGSFTVPKSCKA